MRVQLCRKQWYRSNGACSGFVALCANNELEGSDYSPAVLNRKSSLERSRYSIAEGGEKEEECTYTWYTKRDRYRLAGQVIAVCRIPVRYRDDDGSVAYGTFG